MAWLMTASGWIDDVSKTLTTITLVVAMLALYIFSVTIVRPQLQRRVALEAWRPRMLRMYFGVAFVQFYVVCKVLSHGIGSTADQFICCLVNFQFLTAALCSTFGFETGLISTTKLASFELTPTELLFICIAAISAMLTAFEFTQLDVADPIIGRLWQTQAGGFFLIGHFGLMAATLSVIVFIFVKRRSAVGQGKVHASFSGAESAPVFGQVQKSIMKARYEFTGLHQGQTAYWFEVWSDKCSTADVVIVIFSDIYRSRFTKALLREATLIMELEQQGKVRVFIFDPSKYDASVIRENLEECARFMGDLPGWTQFVTSTTPVDTSKT